MTKGELAKINFESGYNCTQAVVLAFCDDLGFDKRTALMLSQPFGAGMGRLREVCGTVSAMNIILGLSRGSDNPSDRAAKAQLYKEVQQLAEKFRQDNGSIICRELLGLRTKGADTPTPSERTEQYYKTRPCAELCRYAADLIEQHLNK
jgi:C_GCAxxG_C_C family probable redox protein